MFMIRSCFVFTPLLAVSLLVVMTAAASAAPPVLYQDDAEIVALLKNLPANTGVYLPPIKTAGEGQEQVYGFAKRGPDVRDYGNKLAWAPDRGTALYCGANHAAPSRLNDASEYHLGSNTWRLLLPPAGGNQSRVRQASGDLKQGKEVEKNREFLRQWYSDHVGLRDGYLQTLANGGPVSPWHTWDGVAYDAAAKKLLWAVLDTDAVMESKIRSYAEHTQQDPDKLLSQMQSGVGLYSYQPSQGRWQRAMTDEPKPYLRGMGGSLVYIADWQKTIWYCAAQNVSPNDFAMWTYDAVHNQWEELKPNGGASIRNLVHTEKVAPGSEVQMAYSERHKKLVAVLGPDTFVYDLVKNEWTKANTDPRNKAHDASTVFAYDSVSDLFLLLNRPLGQWDKTLELRAFRLATGKWETIVPEGEFVEKIPYGGLAGYFDPQRNVLVVYNSSPRMWVYRYGVTR